MWCDILMTEKKKPDATPAPDNCQQSVFTNTQKDSAQSFTAGLDISGKLMRNQDVL